jgi:hypothetical protein
MPIIDGVTLDIIMVFVCVAMAITQFFFSWKFYNIFMKLLPSIVNVGAIIFFFTMLENTSADWKTIFICSLITLAADILGWITWAVWNGVRNSEPRNPTGY